MALRKPSKLLARPAGLAPALPGRTRIPNVHQIPTPSCLRSKSCLLMVSTPSTHGTPGRTRTCDQWVRNPPKWQFGAANCRMVPLSFRTDLSNPQYTASELLLLTGCTKPHQAAPRDLVRGRTKTKASGPGHRTYWFSRWERPACAGCTLTVSNVAWLSNAEMGSC